MKVALDGIVEIARLLAKNCTEVPGLRYKDTLSPIAKVVLVHL